jgi:glycosyltransferase involved in cell wall biosynthesis
MCGTHLGSGRCRIAVVLPARNEEDRLCSVLTSIPVDVDPFADVMKIVVDDGSEDATGQVAAAAGASVVRHVIGLGKGAALRTGCDIALELGCDLIAVMDADGQHRADDIPALLRPLVEGSADLVLAYRSFTGEMPHTTRLGNWGLSSAFKRLFGTRVRDTQCGMRAFTSEAYRRLRWRSNDYSVETEMLIRAAWARLRMVEVPIETVYHDRYKGTTIADGLRILTNMLRWRLADVT